MNVGMAIEVLASKNRQALMNLLFENKRLSFESLMQQLGFESDFASKFRKRYLEPLTKSGFIGKENSKFVLTPLGFLTFDLFGDIDCLRLYGKLRYLRALESPKTTRQLIRFLGVSRRTCWSQLEKLKSMGLVKTVKIHYKLRDDVESNFDQLPGYLRKIVEVMGRRAVTPAKIARATGQMESSIYSRMSDLMRLAFVEYAGPQPAPKNIFHVYHKLTRKGEEVIQSINSFERVLSCMWVIPDLLSENGRADELEIWEACSKNIENINSFETRRAINVLRMANVIEGNKIEGYALP